MKRLVVVAFAVPLALSMLLTSCTSVAHEHWSVPDSSAPSFEVANGETVGQTFVARFDGLEAIEVAAPWSGPTGVLHLSLYNAPGGETIAESSVPMRQSSATERMRFEFDPIPDSAGRHMYAEFTGGREPESGSWNAGVAHGDAYPDGAMYVDGEPDPDRQLRVILAYDFVRLGAGVKGEALSWIWMTLVAAFGFVVPGWALLALAFHRADRQFVDWHWFLKLTAAIGVGFALYPVRFLIARALGIGAGPALAWLAPVLGLLVIGYLRRRELRRRELRRHELRSWVSDPRSHLRWRPDACDVTLIALTVLILGTRFWVVRELAAPMWGDAYQHALMAQLMLDNGGLFSSWEPYAPYTSLAIQYGFSSLAAVFAWLTGSDGASASLWVGQLVNAAAVLALYPLAVRLGGGNRWAGAIALLIGGLVLTFPAFYVNWGRYAQLAGQAVLPVALWLSWEVLDQERWSLRRDWLQIGLAGLVLTGLTLHYYRTPFLYALFVLVLLVFWALPKYRASWRDWAHVLVRLVAIGMVSLVLFAPWLVNVMSGQLAYGVEAGITIGEPRDWVLADFEVLRQWQTYVPAWAAVVTVAAVAWAVRRRQWMVAGLPVWMLLLLAYRLGALVRLPAANMLRVFAVLIAAYILLSLMAGWLGGEAVSLMERRTERRGLVDAVVGAVVVLLGLWFAWGQLTIVDRESFDLVSHPDSRAFEWVRDETPTDATFLVQGFPYNGTVAGSDAGWWIPLLAERQNTIPPQYAQFNETSEPADHTARVVELYEGLAGEGIAAPRSIDRMCDWGITHVFQGQYQGVRGGEPLYDTDELGSSPDVFVQVYAADRVSIFELNQELCGAERR